MRPISAANLAALAMRQFSSQFQNPYGTDTSTFHLDVTAALCTYARLRICSGASKAAVVSEMFKALCHSQPRIVGRLPGLFARIIQLGDKPKEQSALLTTQLNRARNAGGGETKVIIPTL